MAREKCCGSFPDYVCGDCPHANEEQQAQGGASFKFLGTGPRCMGCFESKDIHLGPELKCPPAPQKDVPPLPEAPPAPAPVAQPARQRKAVCPSCSKPWNGQRLPRPSPEGVFCGTCNQQQFYE
jgi:hypothetical protein